MWLSEQSWRISENKVEVRACLVYYLWVWRHFEAVKGSCSSRSNFWISRRRLTHRPQFCPSVLLHCIRAYALHVTKRNNVKATSPFILSGTVMDSLGFGQSQCLHSQTEEKLWSVVKSRRKCTVLAFSRCRLAVVIYVIYIFYSISRNFKRQIQAISGQPWDLRKLKGRIENPVLLFQRSLLFRIFFSSAEAYPARIWTDYLLSLLATQWCARGREVIRLLCKTYNLSNLAFGSSSDVGFSISLLPINL